MVFYLQLDKNSLPDRTNEPKDIVLCRNGPKSDCDKTVKVKVIKCAENKYVFHLIPASKCPEAYCLEPLPDDGKAPDISNLKLTINAEVKRPIDDNELQFYCDFNPSANTDYYYKVAWAMSQNSISTHELHLSERVQYLSQDDFRLKTMMTEKHLKRLGLTIVCSITATELPASTESVPVISPEKFLGIRALNSSNLVHITNQMGADIYYELTIPFGCEEGVDTDSYCYLDTTLFIPQSSTSNCNKPDITQSNSETNSCGLRFYRHDVGTLKKLHVQPKFPMTNVHLSHPMTLILTTTESEAHPFFSNYSVDTIKVTVSTEQIILNNKVCYAVCDPHMMSFDGLPYENQNTGTFDLYIHKDYNQKIQIETKSCLHNGGSPTCVCGVAVQAGGDVFVLSTCDNNLLDVRFVQCGDRILQNKVNEISKTKYRVTLPSGTYVDIHLVGYFMNVFVYPSVADFKKTSGLCGLFDGTTANDRLNRAGFNDPDPNISWIVNDADNLFNEYVVLEPWADHYRFCTCDNQDTLLTNTASCDADTKNTCNAKPIFTDRCVNKLRKRRDTNGKLRPTDEGDFHKNVQLAFVSNNPKSPIEREKRPKTTYTEETARRDCLKLLNTTAFQKCSKVPGLDFTSTIDDCILDAQITGTMDWTMFHLETIKSLCIQQVGIQKLPPRKDLIGITVINDRASDGEIEIPSNIITEETFEEIRSVSCLNECSGFGNCVDGSCMCAQGHSGDDCSLDVTRPPEMKGIPDKGLCDLQERACRKTSVFANNLVFDNQVKCKIEPQKITARNEVVPEGNYQVTGLTQTYMEVSCPLEHSEERSLNAKYKRSVNAEYERSVNAEYERSLNAENERFKKYEEIPEYEERSLIAENKGSEKAEYERSLIAEYERSVNAEDATDNIVARAYNISLSNDGVHFSEEDTLLVYDSVCVTCSKTQGMIQCNKKNGYCVTNGKCYGRGDTFGSYGCVVNRGGYADWKPRRGEITTTPDDGPTFGDAQIAA